jgi:hypothetical protein
MTRRRARQFWRSSRPNLQLNRLDPPADRNYPNPGAQAFT